MIYGCKDLYSMEVYVERISKALKYSLSEQIIDEILMFFRKNIENSNGVNESIDFLEYLLISVYNNQKESNRSK